MFDQSVFVKQALNTVFHEGMIGLVLTSLMILIFLGSMRATFAVLLSIPISALATFVVLYMLGSTVNTMILGGLALAFSRVIDNSVISLENIYRHLEMGSPPAVAAEQGGAEVNLAVLAATLVDVVDFFPGHAAGRREQVSVFRVGAGVLPVVARLVRGGDDGDPALLLQVSEGRPPRARPMARRERTISGRTLQCLVQRDVQPAAGFLRALGAAGLTASRADAGRAPGHLRRRVWRSIRFWAGPSSRRPMPDNSRST